MSLLRDPLTVLGNPLFIWSPSSPPFTLSNDSSVWFGGSGLVNLPWVSLMFCALFNDAVVSRIRNCPILMFAYRQSFDTWCSCIDCIWCYHKKNFKRVLKSSYFFTKISWCLRFSGTFPPFPGEFAFHFRDLWCPCISASVTRIFPNLRRQGRQSRPSPSG